MAINRISFPSSTPTAVSDYQAQNALLVAALNEGNTVVPYIGTAMSIGYVFNVGGVVYRVDTATTITGTASPYVKITPSGATASASFAASLSGVSWDSTYNGYYDGSGNRYLFDESSAYNNGVITSINTNSQLRGKIRLVGPASLNWVCPANVRQIWVEATGAGGAGATGGSGGGSGAYYIGYVTVIPGTTYAISLSNTGDSTAFGMTFGKGGVGNGSPTYVGGAAGVGSGGALNGGVGGSLSSLPGYTPGFGGFGGKSGLGTDGIAGSYGGGGMYLCGAGSGGGRGGTASAGGDGGYGGGGGGGGSGSGAGGAGGPSFIQFEW